MKYLDVPPSQVASWEHQNVDQTMVNHALRGNLRAIPVFEIPPHLRRGGKSYVVQDGNTKNNSYRAAGVSKVLVMVLESPSDFKYLPQYDEPEFIGMSDYEFGLMIEEVCSEYFLD